MGQSSKVETPTYHNSDIVHALVARYTNTHYEKFDEYEFINFVSDGNHPGGGSDAMNVSSRKSNWYIRSEVTNLSINTKRYLKHLYDCIFSNECDPITNKKMNYWLEAFLIVDAAHGIEDYILPNTNIPKEPNIYNNNGTAKWK